jgi:UDP-N-acetylmuramoyl-L-alanyl-D-glutamate--2,6-diaminopimelate ligase
MNAALMWLLDGIAEVPHSEARVADLTLDSRSVRPGSLFFALAGQKNHGLEFALEAATRGATVVLWEPVANIAPPKLPREVFVAPVTNLRALLGRIADRFFGWPSQHLRITGITGTNGKTTCAFLLAQCLERLGSSAAYIGTIGWGRPDALSEPTHTTPDVITLHRLLAQLRGAGVREVAMEVSSHALDQERVASVRFHTAAFTNLTRDHLDYHKTMKAYGEAKAKLLNLSDLKQVVVNIGDAFGRQFLEARTSRVPITAVWVGENQSGWLTDRTLHATRVDAERQGISLTLSGSFGDLAFNTRLMGRFNAENSLVVLGAMLSLGVSLKDGAAALSQCRPAPGRMELVEAPLAGKPVAVVDYAHTPDALSKALSAAREHCSGELWCVFGCGGDRDPGKRPIMGGIADELADQIIVTDDNPRSENPQGITRDILAGIKTHPARVINDRSLAIATAIREAGSRDLVLIAGKGHEHYQIYGDTRREFNDREQALHNLGAAA